MGSRVLIVEDSDVAAAFGEFLRAKGYEVTLAGSVEDAVPLIESIQPHAVVLDQLLPGENGLTLAQRIRRTPTTQGIRIIMMSAHDDQIRLAAALKSQYDIFLRKPFRMNTLATALAQLLA